MSPRRPTTRGDRRADTAIPIDDDQLVEVDELAPQPRARLAIHELTAGQLGLVRAIALASHHVVVAAGAGAAGIAAVTAALSSDPPLDVILAALPGGEAIIDRARALGAGRPVVIASGTAPASSTARDAITAGAELYTIRPHDPERLAPVLLAAARLAEERRSLSTARGTEAVLRSRLEDYGKADTATGFQRFEFFQRVLELELKRAKRYGYALSVLLLGQLPGRPAPPRDVIGTLRIRAAAAIARAVRDIDMPVEIGDDRFLVLLPYTDLAGAEHVARRAIAAVAAHPPVESGGRAWTTRVAGGVAGLRAGQPVSFAKLMKDASIALRAAIEQQAPLVVAP
ncbi:MAG: diguanylate cyclase [Deltaproteobacteria bacterium]|nr:diguanylate cyclase [Deltaproteobacteria bacterium]